MADDVQPLPAGDGQPGRHCELVLRRERLLGHNAWQALVGRGQGAARADRYAVDGGSRPGTGSDEFAGHEQAARTGDLSGYDEPLAHADNVSGMCDAGDEVGQPSLRGPAALGQRDPQVMGVEQGEAGVVGLPSPRRRAQQAGVRTRAQRDDQRDRADQHPAPAQVTPRPPQPQPGPGHRALPAQVRDHGPAAGRRTIGHDVSAGQFDHPVGHPGDLPVVGDYDHGLARLGAWDLSSSRIWTPVPKSSSPVGSSASRIGLPVARARAIATRCCSPPDNWWAK